MQIKGVFKITSDSVSWTNPDAGDENKIAASDLKAASWMTLHTGCVLQLEMKGGASARYTGFKSTDLNTFKEHFKKHYKIDVEKGELASTGQNWGNLSLTSHSIVLSGTGSAESKTVLELPMADVSQCAVPQNDEMEVQFMEDNSANKVDTVVSMRLYVPKGASVSGLSAKENDEDEAVDDVADLQKEIINRCGLGANTGDAIVEFEEKIGNFLTPRGRYRMELYAKEMRLRGKTYDFTIQYKHISKLFLLPRKENHYAFVISLSVPIRQGASRYQHLVMNVSNEKYIAQLNLNQDELDELYDQGKLSPEMTGELYKVAAKIFRNVIGKKIFTVGTFKNKRGDKSVRCSLKGHDGLLFPLRKSFFFIHKPPTFIAYDTVSSVEFQRYSNAKGQMKSRTFDLQISYRPNGSLSGTKDIVFQGIGRNEFTPLFEFLKSMDINIRNIKSLDVEGGSSNAPDYNEDEDSDFEEEEGDSSDEDWDGGDGGDDDDNDDDDDDDDDEEEEKPKKKRRKKNDD